MPTKGTMEPMGGGPDTEFFRRLLAPLKGGPTRAQAALELAIATHNAAVEEAAKIAGRRAAQHGLDRKRIAATAAHDPRIIDACIAAEDEADEIATEIRKLLRAP